MAPNKDKFVAESYTSDWAQIVSCPGWVGDDFNSMQGEES